MGVEVTPAFSVEAQNRIGLFHSVRTGKRTASSVRAPHPAGGAVSISTWDLGLFLTPPLFRIPNASWPNTLNCFFKENSFLQNFLRETFVFFNLKMFLSLI